jgi:tetratricopeptide (TPR) repeat protein
MRGTDGAGSPEAQRWYEDGMRAARDASWARANKAYSEAVRLSPRFSLARARLAESWFELGDVQRAWREMLRVLPPGEKRPRLGKSDEDLIAGIQYMVAGQFSESEAKLGLLARRAPKAHLAQAWFDYGRSLERIQRVKPAQSAYEKALDADGNMAGAHLRLAYILSRRGDPSGAELHLSAAEKLYQAGSNQEGQADVYLVRALMARRQGTEKAREWLDHLVRLANTTENQHQLVSASLQYTNLALDEGKPEEARARATEAVERARAGGASGLVARALIEVSSSYRVMKQDEEAERCLNEALNVARNSSDRQAEARAAANLGALRQDQGRRDEAQRLYQVALQFYSAAGFRAQSSQIQMGLARVQRDAGDYAGAKRSFEEIRQRSEADGERRLVAQALEGLGSVDVAQERYRAAMENYKKALEENEAAGNVEGANYARLGWGTAAAHLGDFETARAQINESVRRAEQLKNTRLLESAIATRAALHLLSGNAAAAAADAVRAGAEVSGTLWVEIELSRGAPARAAAICGKELSGESPGASDLSRARLRLVCGAAFIETGDLQRGTGLVQDSAQVLDRLGLRLSGWKARAWLVVGQRGDAEAGRAAQDAWAKAKGSLEDPDFESWSNRNDIARLRARAR